MPNPPPAEYLSNIGDIFTCPDCDRIISPVERSKMVDGVKHHVICPPPRVSRLVIMGHEVPITMRPDGRWEILPASAAEQKLEAGWPTPPSCS